MTLERLLPLVVAVLYAVTAMGYISKRDWPMAVLWLAYAIGNVAIVWSCWTK